MPDDSPNTCALHSTVAVVVTASASGVFAVADTRNARTAYRVLTTMSVY